MPIARLPGSFDDSALRPSTSDWAKERMKRLRIPSISGDCSISPSSQVAEEYGVVSLSPRATWCLAWGWQITPAIRRYGIGTHRQDSATKPGEVSPGRAGIPDCPMWAVFPNRRYLCEPPEAKRGQLTGQETG